MENRLELHGADNVRDLGGHETIDRQMTKMQRFIRSDQLCALPVSDLAYLQNYGVRTVVDLRSCRKRRNCPRLCESLRGWLITTFRFSTISIPTILPEFSPNRWGRCISVC
jgi:hypothetical protein